MCLDGHIRVSSDVECPSFTGVVLSEDDELTFPKTVLWLLSCELVGSVKGSWVELESESITTSLSWLRSVRNKNTAGHISHTHTPVFGDIKIVEFLLHLKRSKRLEDNFNCQTFPVATAHR